MILISLAFFASKSVSTNDIVTKLLKKTPEDPLLNELLGSLLIHNASHMIRSFLFLIGYYRMLVGFFGSNEDLYGGESLSRVLCKPDWSGWKKSDEVNIIWLSNLRNIVLFAKLGKKVRVMKNQTSSTLQDWLLSNFSISQSCFTHSSIRFHAWWLIWAPSMKGIFFFDSLIHLYELCIAWSPIWHLQRMSIRRYHKPHHGTFLSSNNFASLAKKAKHLILYFWLIFNL